MGGEGQYRDETSGRKTKVKNIGKEDDILVALAGNPNTGKSTVFNGLTGLKQHTGNWAGKTVTNAYGYYEHQGKRFLLLDLPGTYSLWANSAEEEVARGFLCDGEAEVTVVVVDATCLERNLNLVLQILEITPKVVVCLNLMDEAARKGIRIDLAGLANILGVPVAATNAREGKGLAALKGLVKRVAVTNKNLRGIRIIYPEIIEKGIKYLQETGEERDKPLCRWQALHLLEEGGDMVCRFLKNYGVTEREIKDGIVTTLVRKAEQIAQEVLCFTKKDYQQFDRQIDRFLISKRFGIPVMLALLGVVFWITIVGANYPSQLLSQAFFNGEGYLTAFFFTQGLPSWLHGVLVLGVYRTIGWVIGVMLPPMAIFFPLFTLLEDLGYLPRIAFNLDNFFQKACAHGKQALTMCMGFGCNAAGVVSCRIIDSPRERLLAIITNNFVPCNGRFPTLIALVTIYLVGVGNTFGHSFRVALLVLGVIVFSVVVTLFVSRLLSQTLLRGLSSSFTLELPPYRKPQIGRVIVRSLLDRTLFVLGRAVLVAAPAGVLIWFLANTMVNGISVLNHCALFLDPFARLFGLDGFILFAFILGFPANEIVLPLLTMSYLSTGAMLELDGLLALRELLTAHGWTWLTAVCMLIFVLNHFPCGTTLLTIYQETKSIKWTAVSFFLPVCVGLILCFFVTQTVHLFCLL